MALELSAGAHVAGSLGIVNQRIVGVAERTVCLQGSCSSIQLGSSITELRRSGEDGLLALVSLDGSLECIVVGTEIALVAVVLESSLCISQSVKQDSGLLNTGSGGQVLHLHVAEEDSVAPSAIVAIGVKAPYLNNNIAFSSDAEVCFHLGRRCLEHLLATGDTSGMGRSLTGSQHLTSFVAYFIAYGAVVAAVPCAGIERQHVLTRLQEELVLCCLLRTVFSVRLRTTAAAEIHAHGDVVAREAANQSAGATPVVAGAGLQCILVHHHPLLRIVALTGLDEAVGHLHTHGVVGVDSHLAEAQGELLGAELLFIEHGLGEDLRDGERVFAGSEVASATGEGEHVGNALGGRDGQLLVIQACLYEGAVDGLVEDELELLHVDGQVERAVLRIGADERRGLESERVDVLLTLVVNGHLVGEVHHSATGGLAIGILQLIGSVGRIGEAHLYLCGLLVVVAVAGILVVEEDVEVAILAQLNGHDVHLLAVQLDGDAVVGQQQTVGTIEVGGADGIAEVHLDDVVVELHALDVGLLHDDVVDVEVARVVDVQRQEVGSGQLVLGGILFLIPCLLGGIGSIVEHARVGVVAGLGLLEAADVAELLFAVAGEEAHVEVLAALHQGEAGVGAHFCIVVQRVVGVRAHQLQRDAIAGVLLDGQVAKLDGALPVLAYHGIGVVEVKSAVLDFTLISLLRVDKLIVTHVGSCLGLLGREVFRHDDLRVCCGSTSKQQRKAE